MEEILDSGERFVFETGAQRDIQDNKGRCDLIPFDVASEVMEKCDEADVFHWMNEFVHSGDEKILLIIVELFAKVRGWDMPTMMLELSKHFENGAKKYGESNWQKGLPVKCYINSAIRHYLKWLRGDTDEPHDRAFVWNLIACVWTCKHKPELNDYKTEKALSNSN
jgi:hypothetical protein